ncbi:MAG: hypothetical protein Tp156SUR1554471_33 [Prokaryotic dsDNA virus sp.]|nr:MAG: hypothetical protein Tp156SUR1554471_33 [Prokaryotic dsDNA virus sp.]|tara:strand:+ start:259 stop:771 length:513 start_codon:yes stop_codon:yes gene_type:complete
MDFEKTKLGLETFAKAIIKQAKGNLRRHRNNRFITGSASGDLEGSLGYDLNVSPNSFSLEFFMADYGIYQDEGVKGAESTYAKSRNSRFQYKRMPLNTQAKQSLKNWIKQKGISGNINSLTYVIARSIYRKGLRASFFFTKPFEDNFLKLDEELIEKFALDIDNFLDFTT